MLLEDEELCSTESSVKSSPSRSKRDKYKRISSTRKDELFKKFFFDNKKIKKAAKELNINYSSAKTILYLYRKKIKKGPFPQARESNRCSFKKVPSAVIIPKVELVLSQGGKEIIQKTIIMKPTVMNHGQSAFKLVQKSIAPVNSN